MIISLDQVLIGILRKANFRRWVAPVNWFSGLRKRRLPPQHCDILPPLSLPVSGEDAVPLVVFIGPPGRN